ncbi:hypothetical protein Btru_022573 [Bulinus truncatus]|nr:hypothetical protein Btru_022573 [Bulinus truncatus]
MPLFHCQTLEGFDCSGAGNLSFQGYQNKRKKETELENQLEDFELEQRGNFPKRPCLWSSEGISQNLKLQQNGGLRLPQNEQELSLNQQKQQSQISWQPCENLQMQSIHFHTQSIKTEVPHPNGSFKHSKSMLVYQGINAESTHIRENFNSLPRNMGSNNLAEHFLSRMQWKKKKKEQELQNTGLNNNSIFFRPDEQMDEDDVMVPGLHKTVVDSRTCDGDGMDQSPTAMDSDIIPDTTQYVSSHIPVSPPQNIEYGDNIRRCPFSSCSGLKPSPVSGRLHCHCSASWRGMYGIDNGYGTDYY